MSEKKWRWISCKNPDGGQGNQAWRFQTCKPRPSEGNNLQKMIVRMGRDENGGFKYRTVNIGDTISCSTMGFAGDPDPIKYSYCSFLDYR